MFFVEHYIDIQYVIVSIDMPAAVPVTSVGIRPTVVSLLAFYFRLSFFGPIRPRKNSHNMYGFLP